MKQNDCSGLNEFIQANGGEGNKIDYFINYTGVHIEDSSSCYDPDYTANFEVPLNKQVALLAALPDELGTRKFSFLKELSSSLSLSDIDQAQVILNAGLERAAGVVARVALEGFVRTLFTVSTSKTSIPKFDQCIIELRNNNTIEERHRKHLAELYGLGNECAHPGSTIDRAEIQRMINEIKEVINLLG